MDTLGTGPIIVNAGSDRIDDLVDLDDSFDIGSDSYSFTESSRYVDLVKPGFNEQVRVAQPNIELRPCSAGIGVRAMAHPASRLH